MPFEFTKVSAGLDNESGKNTKLFIQGLGLSVKSTVIIRELSGTGSWEGTIKKVFDEDGTLALAHVKTVRASETYSEKQEVELPGDDNVEVVIIDEDGNEDSGEQSIPIFP